jgi:hypothetical protein
MSAVAWTKCRYCGEWSRPVGHVCDHRATPRVPLTRWVPPPEPLDPPSEPLVWTPAAHADMRALATWAPFEVLRGIVLDQDRVTTQRPELDRPESGLARAETARERRVRLILARLRLPALAAPCGARVHDYRCATCASPERPWRSAPQPAGKKQRRAERRKGAVRTDLLPTQPAGLGDVVRFAYAYHLGAEHAGKAMERTEMERHVAWHFAPHALRSAWRALTSAEQRESEIGSLGQVLVDVAVKAYDAGDEPAEGKPGAEALRAQVAQVFATLCGDT